jgi:hypothetical protein
VAKQAPQIATICECIDHCFSFSMWCEDFAPYVQAEDMMMGLDRAFEIVSDATRLHAFLALRKLDDFLGGVKPQDDDLVASMLGINVTAVLGDAVEKFLSVEERTNINKGAAHLTKQLTLDDDSEVDLHAILNRSIPVFARLTVALRKVDEAKECAHWLDKTDALLKHAEERNAKTNGKIAN